MTWLIKNGEPRELSYAEKLVNFPSVNYTSLFESVNRRKFMQEQFDHFGIDKNNVYLTDRFTKISNQINVSGNGLRMKEVHAQLGTIISHLNLLRNWYVTTDEEYAIFCEDDVSFESIKYWNFTWDEFIKSLPHNWEVIQLTKIVMPYCDPNGDPEIKLKLKHGRWWGAYSLMKRSYVKLLLDKTCVGYNQYILDSIEGDILYGPIIENLLYLGLAPIYNFPLLFEDDSLGTTFVNKQLITEGVERANDAQYWSHRLILKEWQTHGPTLDLQDAMSLNY